MDWATPATMGVAFFSLWIGYGLGLVTIAALSMNREPDESPAMPPASVRYSW